MAQRVFYSGRGQSGAGRCSKLKRVIQGSEYSQCGFADSRSSSASKAHRGVGLSWTMIASTSWSKSGWIRTTEEA